MPKKVRADIGESLRDGLAVLAFNKNLSVNQYAKQVVLATLRGELSLVLAAAKQVDPIPTPDDSFAAEKRGIDIDFFIDEDDYRALDHLAFAKGMKVGEYLYWLLSVHVFGYLHAARIALHETNAQGK